MDDSHVNLAEFWVWISLSLDGHKEEKQPTAARPPVHLDRGQKTNPVKLNVTERGEKDPEFFLVDGVQTKMQFRVAVKVNPFRFLVFAQTKAVQTEEKAF